MNTIYMIGFEGLDIPHHLATTHLLTRQFYIYEKNNPLVPVPKREF